MLFTGIEQHVDPAVRLSIRHALVVMLAHCHLNRGTKAFAFKLDSQIFLYTKCLYIQSNVYEELTSFCIHLFFVCTPHEECDPGLIAAINETDHLVIEVLTG